MGQLGTEGNAGGRFFCGTPDRSRPHRFRPGILIGLFIGALVWPGHAAENCFPRGKSVTFLIPYSIGSLDNLYARMLKTVAEEAIGSQFNPKNVPARGGIEGMKELYNARPSGGTLGVLNAADAIVAALAGAVPFEISEFTIFGRIVDTPQMVYAGRPAFAKGIKSLENVNAVQRPIEWGITNPGGFFAAAVLGDLLAIDANFRRIRGTDEAALKAAASGEVDLVVLNAQTPAANGEIVPILALGPEAPVESPPAKHLTPLLPDVVEPADRAKALSLADISASGLMIAGPPHIPGLRAECIRDSFRDALQGSNLEALARAADKPVNPLAPEAAQELMQKAAQAAVPFQSIWMQALKRLKDSQDTQ